MFGSQGTQQFNNTILEAEEEEVDDVDDDVDDAQHITLSTELDTVLFRPERKPRRQKPSCKTSRHLNCSNPMYNVGSVIYLNNGRSAGLRDVRSVVQSIANMAAPLCAQIYIPPPSIMLRYELHNNGIPLPEHLPWSDYFNITRRQDETNMMATTATTATTTTTSGVTHVVLKVQNGKIAMQQYKKIVAMARKGERFIWEIKTNIYKWRDEFSESSKKQGYIFPFPKVGTGGCMHSAMRGSSIQMEAMDNFYQLINTTTFTGFHIRRGDDIKGCDSSIQFLQQYLTCSFASCSATTTTTTTTGPVVLFTNEDDPHYIEQVRDLVEMHTDTMYHGDLLLQQVIDRLRQGFRKDIQDNFFLFGIADMIMRKATALLSRHRLRCHDCDSVCSPQTIMQ